jgi:hypothetical protein
MNEGRVTEVSELTLTWEGLVEYMMAYAKFDPQEHEIIGKIRGEEDETASLIISPETLQVFIKRVAKRLGGDDLWISLRAVLGP